VFQEHGQEHGFQGPGVGSVDPGLEVQAGQFEEAVKVSLVLPAQRPAELAPALPLLVPQVTVR
jgi:hypothetical protein